MSKNIKNQKKKKTQKGGDSPIDIVTATEGVVVSMIALGKDIFNEIDSITHFKDDINKGVSTQGVPNNDTPSPTFSAPPL